LDSLFVLLTALLVTFVVLLLSWEQPVYKLFSIVPLANSLGRLSDVFLIIIPLATLYISTAVSFVHRIARTTDISDTFLITGLFVPVLGLLLSQPFLYYYFLTLRARILSDDDLPIASAAIYTSIGCLIMLDVFKSIYLAMSQHPAWRRGSAETA
jgi:hypothetical protein